MGIGSLASGIIALCLGVIGIFGRYSWTADMVPFSTRSCALSVFFFLISVPCLYFLVLEFSGSKRFASKVFGVAVVICGIPYHWLGLDRHFYYLNHVVIFSRTLNPPSRPDWFPHATVPAVPNEAVLFLMLFAVGIGVAWWAWKRANEKKKTTVVFFFALFCLVLFETWLHQSLRSPYTYIPHYEKPAADQYWYHYDLFAGGKGSVNADYPGFWHSEEIFFGANRTLNPFVTRLFPFFVSSQFTRFMHPYYVWLVLNVVCWMLAIGSVYLIGREWLSLRASRYGALLMAVGQGPMVYVAQPMPYVFGMTGVAVMLAVYFRLFRPNKFRPRNAVVFGAFIALFLLSYEHHPWLVAVPLIAWASGRSVRWTIAALAIGFGLSFGFLQLCRHLPEMTINETLVGPHPISRIIGLLASGQVPYILLRCWMTAIGFLGSMLASFQFLFLLVLFGVWQLKGKESKRILGLMVLPSFLTYALFELAATIYVKFPRLVYPAYPAIFLLSGWLLDRIGHWNDARGRPVGRWVAWAFLALQAVCANLDVFGFPCVYYYWFYRNLGYTL